MEAVRIHNIAQRLREHVLRMVVEAGAGHVAGPLSAADIMATLYFGEVLRFNVFEPQWEDRDRMVLSAGHYAPLLYAALAEAGFFPVEKLSSYMKLGSLLEGHPVHYGTGSEVTLPGVENTGGPLGQGVSVATGMALALRLKKNNYPHLYCLMSDGELEAGETWEALMFAAQKRLGNLVFIIDQNGIQIGAHTKEVAPLEPLVGKLETFGLQVYEVNGHDVGSLVTVFQKVRQPHSTPCAVVAKTVAGRGVGSMEGDPEWHDRVPTKDQLDKALVELSYV